MFLDEGEYETLVNQRVERLQGMLRDELATLLDRVKRTNQESLQNKKYKKYENVLKNRIIIAQNFILAVADTHFKMLADEQFLVLTTQTDVIQKVEKFKKNVLNSVQKITQNLQLEHQKKQKGSMSQQKNEEDEQADEDVSRKRQNSEKKKSKNYKISIDASMRMIDWLLVNFQKPYPTMAEKQEMATLGGISLTKVNNWFINARERTVKGYFTKEN